MIKRIFPTLLLAAGLVPALAVSAKADIVVTIGDFDEAPDFNPGDFPLTTILGDFNFTIPTGATILGATISGTYGNNDVPGFTNVTALSDYYVDNGTIQVAGCDNFTDPCSAGSIDDSPVAWSYTFSASDLTSLATEFASGSVDFSVAQNNFGAVQTGPITLDINANAVPEPSAMLVVPFGLAGIALLRRLRKA